MKTILIGTGNTAKAAEVERFFPDLTVNWKTLADVAPDFKMDESEPTFEGNARKKAIEIAAATGLATIAGDGGLEIPALGNWPGVKSRRIKPDDEEATDEEIIVITKSRIAGLSDSDRQFRFVSVFAFALPDGRVVTGRGELRGGMRLETHPNPPHGFPYRAFWWLPEFGKYFIDLNDEEQRSINHNKIALDQLRPAINDYLTS